MDDGRAFFYFTVAVVVLEACTKGNKKIVRDEYTRYVGQYISNLSQNTLAILKGTNNGAPSRICDQDFILENMEDYYHLTRPSQ